MTHVRLRGFPGGFPENPRASLGSPRSEVGSGSRKWKGKGKTDQFASLTVLRGAVPGEVEVDVPREATR